MKGKNHFTQAEAEEIRRLLREARSEDIQGNNRAQLKIRDKLRDMDFYITDFKRYIGKAGSEGFTVEDFDRVVRRGHIVITPA